jgi:hypothetical protein
MYMGIISCSYPGIRMLNIILRTRGEADLVIKILLKKLKGNIHEK